MITTTIPIPPPTNYQPPSEFPGFGEIGDLGSNWRIKFADADGFPLNMLSFDKIDFGAIAYKEIFQNVKTILATPKLSAALERLLGVDQVIVDLPIQQASQATIAIIDALYFWEPRCEIMNVNFEPDVIAGHLAVNLQLNIKNVIYGTDTSYDRNNCFNTAAHIQEDQMIPGPPGPPGPEGKVGPRGTQWFLGTTDPTVVAPPPVTGPGGTTLKPQAGDIYMNTLTGDIWQYQVDSTTTLGVATWRLQPR